MCRVLAVALVMVTVAVAPAACHLVFPFNVDPEELGDAALQNDGPTMDSGREGLPGDDQHQPPSDGAIVSDSVQQDGTVTVKGGDHVWSKQLGGTFSDEGRSIAVDSQGNLYLTGYVDGDVDLGGGTLPGTLGNKEIYLASYTSAGGYRWATRIVGPGIDRGRSVAVDAADNVYLAAEFIDTVTSPGGALWTSKGQSDILIASYTSTGTHRWSETYGSTGKDEVTCISADGSGNSYITGSFEDLVSFGGSILMSNGPVGDIFIASYDTNGGHRWSMGWGSANLDKGQGITVDQLGNVYVTGLFQDTIELGGSPLTSAGSSADIFLVSYTSSKGGHRWSKRFGGIIWDTGYDVAADGAGNVYLTGYFNDTMNIGGTQLKSVGVSDIFLTSFDKNGGHRWSKSFGGGSSDMGNGVALDGAGNLFLVGFFEGSNASFGGAPLSSAGNTDILVASYTQSSGAHRWSRRFGDTKADYGYGVAAGGGGVYVTGYFVGNVDFGGGTLVAKGADIFLTRLAP